MKANKKTNLNIHSKGGTVSAQTFTTPTAVDESTASEYAMKSLLHNLMSIDSENEMRNTVKKLRKPKGNSLYIHPIVGSMLTSALETNAFMEQKGKVHHGK